MSCQAGKGDDDRQHEDAVRAIDVWSAASQGGKGLGRGNKETFFRPTLIYK